MNRILVSACLLGEPVRYNGLADFCQNEILSKWEKEGRLVSICPEVEAGLGIPRPAAEISGGNGKDVLSGMAAVVDLTGGDVSNSFIRGARKVLEIARIYSIKIAILKENSPSCGSGHIYDGNFNGDRISGRGVTAEYLEQNGTRVFSEYQISAANEYFNDLDRGCRY